MGTVVTVCKLDWSSCLALFLIIAHDGAHKEVQPCGWWRQQENQFEAKLSLICPTSHCAVLSSLCTGADRGKNHISDQLGSAVCDAASLYFALLDYETSTRSFAMCSLYQHHGS